MVGEKQNKTEEELTVLLPVKTLGQLEEIEEKLLESRFSLQAVNYLKIVFNV